MLKNLPSVHHALIHAVFYYQVVTIQEQQPFGQDRHGRPHHAVFFNQVVGGVLAPSGSTSSSSPKIHSCAMDWQQ